MKRFTLSVLLSSLLVALLLLWSHSSGPDRILQVADGKVVTLSEIIKDLTRARLVFVGELHTFQSHHDAQLKTVIGLRQAGARVAIGLEMFRRDSQPDLDRWVKGELSEKEFQRIYYQNWNYPWPLYRAIFLYARDHKIPMLGLNVAPEITRQVAREGFNSLSDKQRGDLPMVSCRVDREYMAFIRRALGMHGHGRSDFTNFCEAQLVWDSAMAWSLTRFLEKNPEHTVVVIAGSGHSWKRGIPAQVSSRTTVEVRVVLPEIPGRMGREHASLDEADYVWLGLE